MQTKIVGVDCDEGTPVPIPNTVVKLIYAENTWLVTAREDRSMPTSKTELIYSVPFFCENIYSEEQHVTYLIICPLVFLAGFVDAVAGGGGLISLPAYMLAGLPVHNAIATNKMSSTMGTSIATYQYAKSGYIPWKLVGFCIAAAFAGSTCGANLALIVDDYYFKILMLIILPLTAFYVTRPRSFADDKIPYSKTRTTVYSMFIALGVGVYDGFYGPGTGTFLILFLTALAHMDLKKANGTTKAVNLTTNISALVIFLLHAKVALPLGIIAGAFNIAGNYIGTKFFDRSGAKSVKMLTIVVIAIFFVKILLEVLS